MEIAKALILAGRGRREGPRRAADPGHLFPVANRPILFHNLEAVRAAGVLEAAILVDPDAGNAIQAAVGDGRAWGLVVRYAPWQPAAGVPGALAAAGSFVGDEPVLVQHGDALLRERMHAHIAAFARERLDALALRLSGAREWPAEGMTPGYLLSAHAVSILLAGEDAAANPMAAVKASGGRVRIQSVDGCLPCHGGQDALLESNRRALEDLVPEVDPGSLEDSTIHGPVRIHPTARLRRTLVRGPAVIGPGAVLTEAYVGPYTSIGAGVAIEGSEIEHSIVLPDAEIRFVGTRLESSVVGRGARIVRGFRLPGAIRVSLGDDAEVILR